MNRLVVSRGLFNATTFVFFLRYISSSFYCSKHPFQEPMLWFPLNFTICKSLFFFSKTKDPFQEPMLSMQLDKQSRGQEHPGHFSANFEITQKIAGLWVRFAWETLLCSFFPWFVLRWFVSVERKSEETFCFARQRNQWSCSISRLSSH